MIFKHTHAQLGFAFLEAAIISVFTLTLVWSLAGVIDGVRTSEILASEVRGQLDGLNFAPFENSMSDSGELQTRIRLNELEERLRETIQQIGTNLSSERDHLFVEAIIALVPIDSRTGSQNGPISLYQSANLSLGPPDLREAVLNRENFEQGIQNFMRISIEGASIASELAGNTDVEQTFYETGIVIGLRAGMKLPFGPSRDMWQALVGYPSTATMSFRVLKGGVR